MNKNLITGLLFTLAAVSAAAQNGTRTLTLDDCIRITLETGPDSKIARKQYEVTRWSYVSFKASLKPQLRFNLNAPGLDRSIAAIVQDDGTQLFIPQNRGFSSANLSLVQPLFMTGGSLFVSSGLQRVDIFDPSPSVTYQSSPVMVGLQQPIFGYNPFRWSRKIEPIRYNMAERRYLEALQDIATDVTGNFFDVYITGMRLENARFNLSVNDSIYQISQGRFNVGKIAENDLLQAELARLNAEQEVKQLEVTFATAQQDLRIAMGLPDDTPLQILPQTDISLIEVNAETAVTQAHENRSDILDYEVRLLQAESDLAQTRSDNRFNLNLNATYGLNQSGASPEEAYTQPLSSQTVTVGFQVPIFQWGRGKAAVQSSQAGLEQTRIQVDQDLRNLDRNVRALVMGFLQLQEQMLLAAKADTIAQRRFEVARNRYLIGKIDITNLQIAQNDKDNARFAYIESLKSYWMAYYRLRRATLYDFRRGDKLLLPSL